MPRTVLVTQAIPGEGLAPLAATCDLQVGGGPLSLAAVTDVELDKVQGLLCMLTDRIDDALLDAMPALQFVSSISVGVDHVDVAALTARCIPLGNTPGVLVDATADTAFALLLAAARRVAEADRFVRNGQWRAEKRWAPDFFLGKDVSGATLGVLGLGQIGQAVAQKLNRGKSPFLIWGCCF